MIFSRRIPTIQTAIALLIGILALSIVPFNRSTKAAASRPTFPTVGLVVNFTLGAGPNIGKSRPAFITHVDENQRADLLVFLVASDAGATAVDATPGLSGPTFEMAGAVHDEMRGLFTWHYVDARNFPESN